MKITFLGTGHGVPEETRNCQSMLIEEGDGAYLVDGGAPVMETLLHMRYDFKKVKKVFITHFHSDHILGLLSFMNLIDWYYKELEIDVYLPEQAAVDSVYQILQTFNESPVEKERVRLHLYQEGLVFQDENISVTAYPTLHLARCGRPAYGFLIGSGGKEFYITGDLQQDIADYPPMIRERKLELLITECAHFTPELMFQRLEGCMAPKVMMVHTTAAKYEPIRALGEKSPFTFIFPNDGDSYVLW